MRDFPNLKSTSTGGEAKIKRAINQIQNARRLIAGLPKKYYEKNETSIETITQNLKETAERIQKELAEL